MKKTTLYILAAVFLFADSASSQLFDSKAKATTPKREVVVKEVTVAKSGEPEIKKQKVTAEEVEAIINKTDPAATMTPEQKSEIDLAAKKSMRVSLERQSTRDRRDFIDVMTNSEKVQARRKALLEGKSIEDAKKVEDEIKSPEVNPKSNTDMEKYMHTKAGLLNE
jgi:electron transfer flavoprotein alpha subunit